jgi:hypothetical protein
MHGRNDSGTALLTYLVQPRGFFSFFTYLEIGETLRPGRSNPSDAHASLQPLTNYIYSAMVHFTTSGISAPRQDGVLYLDYATNVL